MAKVVDLIKECNEALFRLRKCGVKSLDILTDDYTVYQVYLGYENVKEKMVRYSMTAEKTKVSINTVQRVVKLMEKNI